MLKRIFTRRRTLAFLAMTLFAGGGGAGMSLLYPGFGPTTNADGETETASLWSRVFNNAIIRANNEEEKTEGEGEGESAAQTQAAPNLPPPPESFDREKGFGDDKGFVPSPPGASGGGYEPTPAPPSFTGFANADTGVEASENKQQGPGEAAASPHAISQPPSFGTSSPAANAVAAPEALNSNGLRSGETTGEQELSPSAPEPYYAPLPREVTQEELYGAGPPEDPYAETAPAPPTANYGTPNPYAPQASASSGAGAYGGPSGAAGRLAPDYGAEPLPGSSGPGAGVPGSRALEGIQSADVKLVKNAPAEIQVGVPATFELKVLNASEKEVRDVVIRDQTPKGTRFLEGSPQPSALADGTLVWNIGSLKPQEELTITMRVMPEQEGEIGSVATVMFAAEASARTVCTKPRLAIKVAGPANVLIGQPAECQLVISNEGTGAAIGVAIEADLPPQFKHPAGAQLEYEIGALQPGESKTLPLSLMAAEAGATSFPMRVRAEGVPGAEDMLTTEVIAPQLAVAAKGPTRRYIQRQAKYEIFVQNPGTAPAQEVELAAYLPRGMQFVQANNSGSYDPETHAVYWSLAELPTQERGSVEVAVMPVEEGEQKIRVEAGALLELQAESELGVVVEAQVDLDFEIASLNDPIEIGADSIYEIRVANLGTKAATGVVIAASFPPGLQPLPDQAGSYRVEGQRIVFTNVSRLEPGDEIVVKAAARGATEGDHRVGVQVASAEVTTPILKEARTKVYRDQ